MAALTSAPSSSGKDVSSDDEGLSAQSGSPSHDTLENHEPLPSGPLGSAEAGHAPEAVDRTEKADSHGKDSARSPSPDGRHDVQGASVAEDAVPTQSEGHESDTTLSDDVSEPQSFDQTHSLDITPPASPAPGIAKSNNDLEDIVNLLEARPRPVSMMSIPDEE